MGQIIGHGQRVNASKGHPRPASAHERSIPNLGTRSHTIGSRYFTHDDGYDSDDEDNGQEEHRVPGFLWPDGKEPINTLAEPDDGTPHNIMTLRFASTHGFYVRGDPQFRRRVQLPDGSHLDSVGQVDSRFMFSKEPGTVHHLTFHVFDIERGLRDVILGSHFLNQTYTLTFNQHRLATVKVYATREEIKTPAGTKGQISQRLHGFLDGEMVEAVPDYGSVVNVLSKLYAEQRGFLVEKIPDDAPPLEFYDGSMQAPFGQVHAEWAFEDAPMVQPIQLTFVVFSQCPHQVLLGQPLLWRHNAYAQHFTSFHNVESETPEGVFDLFKIRWSSSKAKNGEDFSCTFSTFIRMLLTFVSSSAISAAKLGSITLR
jgi:hypothetical protein